MEADATEDILGPKKRNYDFLQFVRDKKYAEALILGKQSTVYPYFSSQGFSRQSISKEVRVIHREKRQET